MIFKPGKRELHDGFLIFKILKAAKSIIINVEYQTQNPKFRDCKYMGFPAYPIIVFGKNVVVAKRNPTTAEIFDGFLLLKHALRQRKSGILAYHPRVPAIIP